MTPLQIDAWVRLGIQLLIGAAIIWAVVSIFNGYNDLVRAPVETELKASRANNAGFKAAAEKGNAATKGRIEAAKRREEAAGKAIDAAGTKAGADAARILTTPAPGESPIARAVNRLNMEMPR